MSIDTWLTAQTTSSSTPAQASTVITCDLPPHLNLRNTSTSWIEEVIESHILQIREAATPDEEQEEEYSQDIFEVFATKKKKRGKAPELLAPPPATPAPATASSTPQPNAQYKYHCDAKDQQLVLELEEYLMQGKLSLTTPAHIFTASYTVRKNIAEKLKVHHVETNKYKVVSVADLRLPLHHTMVHDDFSDLLPPPIDCSPAFCLPLQEIDILLDGSTKVPAILDTGSQIVVIQHDIALALGARINPH